MTREYYISAIFLKGDFMAKTMVIALGGNAIKSAGEKGTYEEQMDNVRKTMDHIGDLVKAGWKIVITHGNGPQVGSLLIQQAEGASEVPPQPMFVCGAMTQGQIGFLIQQSLQNKFRREQIKKSVATVVTQVVVDKEDEAFKNPRKPVGPFYKKEDIPNLESKGYTVVEDAGRGYRRVVPSPAPIGISEIDAIKVLIERDVIVIASGGGGIPVVNNDGQLKGVDAVIDKDRAGQLLATELEADVFIVLTDVEKVALYYNSSNQKDLDRVTVEEVRQYLEEGHFAPGSMKPKVEAVIKFLVKGGDKAIITHPFKVLEAIEGKTGTHIVKT